MREGEKFSEMGNKGRGEGKRMEMGGRQRLRDTKRQRELESEGAKKNLRSWGLGHRGSGTASGLGVLPLEL